MLIDSNVDTTVICDASVGAKACCIFFDYIAIGIAIRRRSIRILFA